MRAEVCIAIIGVLVFSYQRIDAQDFHLPRTVIPEKHKLMIHIDLYKPKPMFWGYVYIDVRCEKATSEITLHTKDLLIIRHQVRVGLFTPKALVLLDIDDVKVIKKSNQLVIAMKEDLVPENRYQIFIHYFKDFDSDFTEFQIKTFTVDSKSIKVAITNFDAGGAPAVFPCFNNINFKSKFKIYLAHPRGVYGFSNMPRMDNSNLDNTNMDFVNGWVIDEFEESVLMTSFQVNFALMEAKGKKITDAVKNVPIQIWSLFGSRQIDAANVLAHERFKFYTEYFGTDYSLPKLDILILPNISPDNEKYGLSMLSESKVFYPNSIFDNEEFDIARAMCHVVSHQWIGSYVTMASLSESWFHAALSDYLEGPCLGEILKSSHAGDRLLLKIAEKMLAALDHFETLTLPISVFTEDMQNATQGFPSSLTPEKAFILIRMMNFFVGDQAFHESIIAYMTTYGLDNSSLDQIWEIFTEEGRRTGTLLKGTVKEIMDSWISKTTYPVVSVRRDFENKFIVVNQKPFTAYMSRKEKDAFVSNDCPMIPVNGKHQKFVEGGIPTFSFWLNCADVKVDVPDDVGDDEWLIFNSKMVVLSRTDYDLRTWGLLKATLLDEAKFDIIDPLTRAHLIYDIFEFCQANISEITYDFALNTIKYLKHEDKHCVWFLALTQLKRLYSNFVRTDLLEPFKRYIKEIMTVVFDRPEFYKIDDLPIGAANSLKKLIVDASCLYGVDDCELQSKKLFNDWYTNSIEGEKNAFSKIPPAIRYTVLSTGIEENDQEHWDHLLTEYRKYPQLPDIRYDILEALAGSKNKDTLERFLDMSLDPEKILKIDSLHVFKNLFQNKNGFGFPLMEKFLKTNYYKIVEYRNDDDKILASYIKVLIQSTNNREELERVKTFIEEIRFDKNLFNLDHSYDAAIFYAKWYERNEPKFKEFFEKFPSTEKYREKKSSPILGGMPKLIPPEDDKDKNV